MHHTGTASAPLSRPSAAQPPPPHTPSRTHAGAAQIVCAVIGVYAAIIGVVKIKSAMGAKKPVPKAAAAPAPAPAVAAAGSKWGFETPTLETFDTWSANAENWKKWEAFMDSKDGEEGVNKFVAGL